jgi:hypothetical protein
MPSAKPQIRIVADEGKSAMAKHLRRGAIGLLAGLASSITLVAS